MTLVPISEAAMRTGLSIDTLRRWDKGGIIRAKRDNRGVRHFDIEEIERLQAKKTQRANNSGNRFYKIHKDSYSAGLKSIDLFAGAGGTALGLENAGFNHVLLSELDTHAANTLRTNRPEWNVIEGDVAKLNFTAYLDQLDLVEGGFPCQAFSYAGHSRGFEDTRGTLFFEFARAIKESMPKVFVGENVRGLLRHDKGRTLQTMIRTLKSIKHPETGVGYHISYKVVRAQYHDVPQKRERLLIMGVRKDVGSQIFFPKERDYIVTIWDAIGDRPISEGQVYPSKKKQILDLIPEGGYWKDLPDNLQREYLGKSYFLSGGKTGMARRLAWDEPSLTLTCSPAQKQTERCHPDETRPLNVREYARIQTFPDDWLFEGGISQSYKQIGNAVPVNLGYYIGKSVTAMIKGVTPEVEYYVSECDEKDYV
ncbi:DNA (cytosine-5-)-methyltransferase [Corynebacterium amycolatum]|uniref:DNA (cytosine-5-)-methyltransferase n=1 Tax=Corynebacterium amycolatum TaxID=43765 RepID=UPI00211A38E0|nr:DNA (cytosine-5-)-methyltransferase [Corynebacterium amycolatum]MCQ9172440.1 DNA (cytosine-5-)-methyltransferase [Corynebacterium amycolatum]